MRVQREKMRIRKREREWRKRGGEESEMKRARVIDFIVSESVRVYPQIRKERGSFKLRDSTLC